MKKWLKKLGVLGLAAGLWASTGVGAASAQEDASQFEGETVTVGLVPGSAEDVWSIVVEKAAADGIELEIVLFNDYVQPNIALQDGSIDLNAFQHVAFLDNWNEANDGNLTPVGYTFVSPMGAYSDKIASLDELQPGDVVAIPNDPTNGGRAILALEIAGLIEVDDEAGYDPTPSDITDNPLELEFEELDANQLPLALPDVAVAFINTNFANDAGLSLHEDAIFVDADYPEQLNEGYRNVIAAHGDNVDNDLFAQIVSYYNSDEVAKAIYETTDGADKPAWEGAVEYQPEEGEDGEEADSAEETSDEVTDEE